MEAVVARYITGGELRVEGRTREVVVVRRIVCIVLCYKGLKNTVEGLNPAAGVFPVCLAVGRAEHGGTGEQPEQTGVPEQSTVQNPKPGEILAQFPELLHVDYTEDINGGTGRWHRLATPP